MNYNLSTSPPDKKKYIQTLASALVNEYGKKRFYSPTEVNDVGRNMPIENSENYALWGMSIFCSKQDFVKHYDSEFRNRNGEEKNDLYEDMKIEMLFEFSTATIDTWDHIPNLDYDTSWLDFGDLLEGIFEGIGDFIGGILDAV